MKLIEITLSDVPGHPGRLLSAPATKSQLNSLHGLSRPLRVAVVIGKTKRKERTQSKSVWTVTFYNCFACKDTPVVKAGGACSCKCLNCKRLLFADRVRCLIGLV
eukprot:6180062-Pleurochrysis_carterae.AAC.2